MKLALKMVWLHNTIRAPGSPALGVTQESEFSSADGYELLFDTETGLVRIGRRGASKSVHISQCREIEEVEEGVVANPSPAPAKPKPAPKKKRVRPSRAKAKPYVTVAGGAVDTTGDAA